MLTFESYFTEIGKAQGIEEGIEKGKLEGKLETAKNLKSIGIDTLTISKATGLSIEEVEML